MIAPPTTRPPVRYEAFQYPVLIAAMGAHYFIRDNEIHYEVAASKDKDFVVIEGSHPRHQPLASPASRLPASIRTA